MTGGVVTHELTVDGVFIPAPTDLERDLIYTHPTVWADRAANKVVTDARRAYGHANNQAGYPNHPGNQWSRRRAELVAQGLEQWLLWMEKPRKEDK